MLAIQPDGQYAIAMEQGGASTEQETPAKPPPEILGIMLDTTLYPIQLVYSSMFIVLERLYVAKLLVVFIVYTIYRRYPFGSLYGNLLSIFITGCALIQRDHNMYFYIADVFVTCVVTLMHVKYALESSNIYSICLYQRI